MEPGRGLGCSCEGCQPCRPRVLICAPVNWAGSTIIERGLGPLGPLELGRADHPLPLDRLEGFLWSRDSAEYCMSGGIHPNWDGCGERGHAEVLDEVSITSEI